MKSFITNYILVLLFSLSGCESPVEPPIDDTPPGKRDYVWSIDSVDYGNLPGTIQLESIWGSSATDVWGAGYTSDVRDCLWHFDSIKWSRATEGTPITTGGSGSRIVGRVWGTAADDVWAVGDEIFSQPSFHGQAFVMHYDGSVWNDVTGSLTNLESGLFDVFEEGKDNFWLAAYENVVHYNSGKWDIYSIGENLFVSGINGSKGNIFAVAYDISAGGNRVIIVRIKNDQLSIIDETTLTGSSGNYNGKFEPSKLWVSRDKLYTAWHRISVTSILENGSIDQSGWHSVLDLPEGQFFVNTFYQNTKNFFASGYPSLLYHNNGSDWKNLIISINNSVIPIGEYSAVWADGNEVFISDTENGIIYHGR
jgi:hypothetical protein